MDELHVVERTSPPAHRGRPLETSWHRVLGRGAGGKGTLEIRDGGALGPGADGRARDCLWVAKLRDQVVGTVGIRHEGSHVARLHCFRIHPDWQQTSILARLIQRVHRYCWNEGYLKLLVESHVIPGVVREMLEDRGFQLVRRKRVGDSERLEYLVDLYGSPRRGSEPG
jgi:GNAT superfamily N-acetyltransferase